MNELVLPKDGLRELALFAGAGGGILGGLLLGWRTVCAVEIEDYPRRVLLQRQADGLLPRFPVWDDARTFSGKPWRGKVDVISGGFPCQDISCAGKGKGITGEKSGLWKEFARIIGEVQPRFAFVENSPMLTSRGLGTVLGDLSEMGYDARWGVVGAHNAGAPHKRDRIWIVATDSSVNGCNRRRKRVDRIGSPCEALSNTQGAVIKSQRREAREWRSEFRCSGWWTTEPSVGRVAHGVADRVDRLKAIGNGQVPACAALAWSILSGENND